MGCPRLHWDWNYGQAQLHQCTGHFSGRRSRFATGKLRWASAVCGKVIRRRFNVGKHKSEHEHPKADAWHRCNSKIKCSLRYSRCINESGSGYDVYSTNLLCSSVQESPRYTSVSLNTLPPGHSQHQTSWQHNKCCQFPQVSDILQSLVLCGQSEQLHFYIFGRFTSKEQVGHDCTTEKHQLPLNKHDRRNREPGTDDCFVLA